MTLKTERNLSGGSADLVVYGKIFTSEGGPLAEAFAVKDGRFIYVGDRNGAEAFIEEGRTEVVDHTGKGLVMPSCGNGHAHYSMGFAIKSVGTIVAPHEDADKFLKETVPAAVSKAKASGATSIFGFGWEVPVFEANMPTRQQLDAICSDIPMYFADEEGHKGLVNTIALVNAGIMKEDGTVLKQEDSIRGGEIVMGADGTPTGYLKEQAGTFVRYFLDNDRLFPVDMARANLDSIQEHLLSSMRQPVRWTMPETCTLSWGLATRSKAGWMWMRRWTRLQMRKNSLPNMSGQTG